MASVVRNANFTRHMFRELTTFIRPKRSMLLRTVRFGSLVFLTRSRACMAHTVNDMAKPPKQNTPDTELIQSRFGWLGDHVPCFSMDGRNIRVINEPWEFYDTFKGMTQNAKKRIVIASLYLGTGQHEKDLVDSIEEACKKADKTEDFKVHILLDYTRGSRGGSNSSRTMLLPLLQKYRDKVNIYLYHTPDLRGLLKQCMPERINETVGLSHMKIYMVDDDVIISGANLSESYFTNRQDRYIQFRECPGLTNYLTDIVKAMANFTFHLQSDNTTTYPQHSPHPYEGSDPSSVFKSYAGDIMKKVKESVSQSQQRERTIKEENNHDTWLCPLIQMGLFGIQEDEIVTKQLFERTQSEDTVLLASGYFNLTSDYMDTILNNSKGKFEILTAAPEANGFFDAKGISGYIPTAYTDIAQKFYTQVCRQCQDERITIYEYFRSHWTFHGKGLWYYLPNSALPVMTFVGSPNFGHRSVYRDLECQIVVMTTNPELQEQLHQEHKRLYDRALAVTDQTFQQPDRHIPLWVKFVTKFMRNFF